MRKFILKVLLFFLIIAVVDVCMGVAFRQMSQHPKGGDNARNNYICDSTHEEILVMGSSRALHHYNPAILRDSLRMSCYNCGQDGNGVILNYGRLLMTMKRYQPKMIIYDISPDFDIQKGDNRQFLGWLKGFYDREGIADIFESVDKNEPLKMRSAMYRYNSKFIQVLGDYVHPTKRQEINGFRPLAGELDPMKLRDEAELSWAVTVDSLKLDYITKLIVLCRGPQLVFVVSPMWYQQDSAAVEPIRKLCSQYQIPFLDYSHSPKYVHHDEYFKDGSHLNAKGADEFSRDVAHDILACTIKPKNI